MAKTLLIDLDGVLNCYNGNYSELEIPEPKDGALEFLAKLSLQYKIEIFTVRNLKQTVEWLIKYKLDKYVFNVTNVKNPYASVIIDDRALRFEGDYEKTLAEILEFKPYWK